jgi:hypothetical protein
MLKVQASSISDEIVDIFHLSNPSGHNIPIEFTYPLTELFTRKYFWGKAQPTRKANNLAYMHEQIV